MSGNSRKQTNTEMSEGSRAGVREKVGDTGNICIVSPPLARARVVRRRECDVEGGVAPRCHYSCPGDSPYRTGLAVWRGWAGVCVPRGMDWGVPHPAAAGGVAPPRRVRVDQGGLRCCPWPGTGVDGGRAYVTGCSFCASTGLWRLPGRRGRQWVPGRGHAVRGLRHPRAPGGDGGSRRGGRWRPARWRGPRLPAHTARGHWG